MRLTPLAEVLDFDLDQALGQFEFAKANPLITEIVLKANVDIHEIAWVEARSLEFPEVRIAARPQRHYLRVNTLSHVLGYIGQINPEQLGQQFYRENGYKPGDIIGKEGIEAQYEKYLRGIDGYRRVAIDNKGNIKAELELVEPQPGQDLILTIDLRLQLVAESELANSPQQRGVIIAMDPNNGEVLALASYPTFDPNLFSQRISTKEGAIEFGYLRDDPSTPLLNRAIKGRYPPASTWKILMGVAGLQQGAITAQDSNLLCGEGITVGGKFTRCMGDHGTPDLKTAIAKSCDGYFYRLGLKMGLDGIQKLVTEFELDKRTGVDLPYETLNLTPSPALKAQIQRQNSSWNELDTVYASFGQVYEVITPISLLRAIAAIGVHGKLYVPHLLKELLPAGQHGSPDYRPGRKFLIENNQLENPKLIPIAKDYHSAVLDGMRAVVSSEGTAGGIGIEGFDIAGKTGTAQVVELGKDVGANKDHSWFVSFAPASAPEIAVIALIENAGFGSQFAAPAAEAVYEAYYTFTRFEEPRKQRHRMVVGRDHRPDDF